MPSKKSSARCANVGSTPHSFTTRNTSNGPSLLPRAAESRAEELHLPLERLQLLILGALPGNRRQLGRGRASHRRGRHRRGARRRRRLRPRGNLGRGRRELGFEIQLILEILRLERGELLLQFVLVEVRGVPHGLTERLLHLAHLLRLLVDVVHDLVDLVDVGLLVDLLHGAGAGLERGERLRGRLAALQRDDLLLELELLVLELLNLLLVELLLLEALQRGALVLGAVEVLRLLELGRHLLMQQRLALLEHGQRVLQLLDRAQGARLRRAEAPAAGSGTPAAPAAGTLASEQFLEHPPSKTEMSPLSRATSAPSFQDADRDPPSAPDALPTARVLGR
mmetsp:Transcript_9095/g.35499  ORF Transcript_9095/g.35499 Transcript_9095/m.35499 type:complete len:338 (+) Transcript_9095:134-1147(+)